MNTPRRRARWSLCVLLANTPAVTGCFAISSYQNARITEPGPSRATFALSTLGPGDNDDGDNIAVVDMRVRKNLAPERADMGFTMSGYLAGEGAIFNVGVDPRLAIVNGYVAMDVPFYWTVATPLAQIAPGVVVTLPVARGLEVNAGARAVVSLLVDEGSAVTPVYTVGLGLSGDLRRWAIRPEVGFMPIDDEWLVQLGVGFDPPVAGSAQ